MAMHDMPESALWFDSNFLHTIEDPVTSMIDPSLLWKPSNGKETPEGSPVLADPSSFENAMASLEASVRRLLRSQKQSVAVGQLDVTMNILSLEDEISEALRVVEVVAPSKVLDVTNAPRRSTKLPRVTVTDESDMNDGQSDILYNDLYHNMRLLHEDLTRRFIVVPEMKFCRRRQVHAVAHFMRLNHMSIGKGREKCVLLSNDTRVFSPALKWAIRESRNGRRDTKTAISSTRDQASTRPQEQRNRRDEATKDTITPDQAPSQLEEHDREGPEPLDGSNNPARASSQSRDRDRDLDRYCRYRERSRESTRRSYHSSGGSRRSDDSAKSTASGRKRRRQTRLEGGFVCCYEDCEETFDRRCDLTQHERSHLPYEQRPYGCESCEKRFLFPKDLRRHEATHRDTHGVIHDDPDRDDTWMNPAGADMKRTSRSQRWDINDDFNDMKQKWKKVDPIAKPLLPALAKAYLEGARQ